jgi:CxxC motif-containing protein
MKEIICITCPKGCHLKVDEESFSVTGNSCPRGAVYGANELRSPVRVVTSTVVVEPVGASIARPQNPDCLPRTSDACPYEGSGKDLPRRLPVKTDRPIPKGKMFAVMAEINRVRATPPIKVGDVLIPHVAGTDGNVVATKSLE